MYFLRAERFVFFIICALFAVDLVLVAVKGIGVDIAGYCLSLAIGGGLLCLGQIYRWRKREERMAAALISAGLFILFSICGSVFNYMFLPIQYPTIDHALIHIDSVFGYEWRRAVELVAHFPFIGTVLFIVYATSLPQLLLTIIILGFRGDYRRLHHFLLTGVLGALTAIMFWIFFPTFGPSAYQDLPRWVLEAIPLAVTPDYGKELIQLGGEGPTLSQSSLRPRLDRISIVSHFHGGHVGVVRSPLSPPDRGFHYRQSDYDPGCADPRRSPPL